MGQGVNEADEVSPTHGSDRIKVKDAIGWPAQGFTHAHDSAINEFMSTQELISKEVENLPEPCSVKSMILRDSFA